jgi:uroporphyrinogen-III synthase
VSERGTLAGRRIVVTRRREQAESLARLLSERGATVLFAPATDVGPPEDCGPLDQVLRRLEEFDWVSFSSANAVAAVRDRLEALGLPGALGVRGPRLASVGPATTRALEEAFPEDSVALEPESDYRAAGLLRAFEARGVAGARVLHPASSRARDELPSGLRALGAEVTVAVAYATVDAPGLSEAVERCSAEGFDAVTFAAPSAAQAFARAVGASGTVVGAGEGPREGLPAAVIGPTTETAAREAGFRIVAVASPSTAEGLVAALEGALGPVVARS